jgi:hypothetical protein
VSFGNASGLVPPFALAELNNHGSLFATRPKLNDYVSTRKELLEGADTLFAAVINGKLHVPINHAYALKDAAKAHTELESRATTGTAICGRSLTRTAPQTRHARPCAGHPRLCSRNERRGSPEPLVGSFSQIERGDGLLGVRHAPIATEFCMAENFPMCQQRKCQTRTWLAAASQRKSRPRAALCDAS